MGQVVGIGGVFFKAQDTAQARDWYARVLGLAFTEWGSAMFANPQIGMQQLTPFAETSDYFAPATAAFMINLIVDDMDAVLAHAEAAGETPLGREDHDYGRFAWLLGPGGVKIELWQPLGPSPV
ncbi:MAG: glyoxalase [Phenylobacterium sp.]|nr:glyoxalase [Phenylobacterium sp.]